MLDFLMNVRLLKIEVVLFSDVVKHIRVENHPSETALDDYEFDFVIDNNSDIPSLVEKVKQIIQ